MVVVGITAPVPRRVVGVDRAEASQPRRLPRPGGAAAHQPVDQNQRAPGPTPMGQRCGDHRCHCAGNLGEMTVVKINAIEVPPGAGPELEKRFAHRAHAVDNQPGFLGFQLLRPVSGDDRYFVVTQWESEEAFQAWASGPAIAAHAGERANPVSTGASLLEFEVVMDVARSDAEK